MELITADFETYYDKDFSLSKLTTEEYINDPRFEVIGLGIKYREHKAHWFTHDQVEWAIKKVPWDKVALVAHNAKFDAAILAWRYGVKPAFIIDTMSMARPFHNANVGCSLAKLVEHYQLGAKGHEVVNALGKRLADFTPEELAKYGEYCINDCELTYALLQVLIKKLPFSELRLINTTMKMYIDSHLRLDTSIIQQEIDQEAERKASLLSMVDQPKSVFSSNDKFAGFLTSLGIDPPMKPSPKKKNPDGTPMMTYAFAKGDADFVALLDHEDDLVSAAVEVRLGVKSTQRETRAARFMSLAERTGGILPVPLGYYNAHTGRYGGEDKINLQNLQRTSAKDPTKGLLRKAITADEGELLIVEDLSQIEARLLVWQAGQHDRVEAFAAKRDVYSEQASVIFGRHVDRKKNPDDFTPGFIGKAVVLGAGYGLGFLKFAKMIYVGMLGEKGVKFDGSYVQALSVDVAEVIDWVKSKPVMYQKLVEEKPAALTMLEWETHVACANSIITTFRANAKEVVKFWSLCGRALQAMHDNQSFAFGGPTEALFHVDGNSIILPNGMPLTYEGLEKNEDGEYSYVRRKEGRRQRVKVYGGALSENLTQALARIVITDAMTGIEDQTNAAVALQVHDEIVSASPEEDAKKNQTEIRRIMRTPPKWAEGLPLDSEGSVAFSYGEAKL